MFSLDAATKCEVCDVLAVDQPMVAATPRENIAKFMSFFRFPKDEVRRV